MTIFCLIIWLLVFGFISWRHLEWGIYLIVFTLPCYLLRPNVFGVPTTVLELEIYILLAIWLIKKSKISARGGSDFGGKNQKSKLSPSKRDPAEAGQFKIQNSLTLLISVGLILTGAIFSTIFSSDLRVSLGILKGWFFDPLIFGFIVFCTFKTKEQIKNLLSWLAASGITVAIVSLFYYLIGHLTFDGRLRAFYLSPNHLSMYLAPCLLFAVCFLLSVRKKTTRCLWSLGSILMGSALYLTYSYSTWLGILAGLMFFNFIFLKSKMKIWGVVGLIILIIFLFYLQSDSPKLQNLVQSPRSSFQSRIMVWQSAIAMIKDNPIFGIGPGMFQEHYLNYQRYFSPYLEWAVPQPHNIFLAFWLQTGILGLIGFLGLIIWFFRRGFFQLTNSNQQLTTILMSIMVYTLIHGLLDATYWKNDLSVIFWLMIILMISAEKTLISTLNQR